jgi:hypothetical protein
MTHSNLIRQIEYMKVENEILRSKLPKRITTTPAEKRRLIKYGLPLRGQIKSEGFVGTIKRECLDHFFVFGEEHLKYLIREYVGHYDTKRPHSGMNNEPLGYRPRKAKGKIKCQSRLGGMIKHYYWG